MCVVLIALTFLYTGAVDDGAGNRGKVLVFCRTPKAASSTSADIMKQLSDLQGYNMHYVNDRNQYWPSSSQLMNWLAQMPDGSLYVNHCYYIEDHLWLNRIKDFQGKNATKAALYDPRRYIWINIVREPIERAISLYYYMVDESMRKERAVEEVERRAAKGFCMCPGLEFNQCVIRTYEQCHKSVIDKEMQLDLFYGGRVVRSIEKGLNKDTVSYNEHMRNASRVALLNAKKYHSIALSSHIDLSFQLWKKTLPQWFGGYDSRKHYAQKRRWEGSYKVGNLSMNGAITNKAKDILKSMPSFQAEYTFYHTVELMFYAKVAASGLIQGAIDTAF